MFLSISPAGRRLARALAVGLLALMSGYFSLPLCAVAKAAETETVYLDELDFSQASQGWNRPLTNGRNQRRQPLAVNGREFGRGLWSHAEFSARFDLEGKAVRFRGWVGVDDASRTASAASVEFNVVGDGKELWTSGVMRGGDDAKEVDVSLEGVQSVELVVADAGDGIQYDHATWGEAHFVMRDGARPGRRAPPQRWQLIEGGGGVEWDVAADQHLPHQDHVEMSGRYVSIIVTYGVDAEGRLTLERKIVWPMLRTLPENTHANVIRDFAKEAEPVVTINGEPLVETPVRFVHQGMLKINSSTEQGVAVARTVFPMLRQPAVGETITLQNISQQPLTIGVQRPPLELERTDPSRSRYGVYELGVYSLLGQEDRETTLQPGATLTIPYYIYGQKESEPLAHPIFVEKEQDTRQEHVESLWEKLILKTPDPYLNQMFAFAKLRGSESIYATKGGLMHGPGGGRYYAAIWANDQAEYINPFFAFLGDTDGIESALNSYRHFARFMNDEYKPIPSSIISEGDGIWHGRGDRGDMAMIAYGAGRFALAYGDQETARELWPLVEWCLEFCRRKVNRAGVVESDSDELEGRFPAGDANLCTSSLYYDALVSAAMLGEELGLPDEKLAQYKEQASAMRAAIESFGADVEGFPTYRYYDGNDVLRAWICIPLTVDIFDRRDGTIDALFSKRLWTPDGLATQAGDTTFWDRSTLYGLRGAFAAGETERGLDYLQAYTRRRLVGEHVPYPVEAWPEGNQRHLSAESGLYCRIFIEGLFGIRPAGFSSFHCTPRLPADWDEMALEDVHAFGREFDVAISRDADKLSVAVTQEGQAPLVSLVEPGQTVTIEFTKR